MHIAMVSRARSWRDKSIEISTTVSDQISTQEDLLLALSTRMNSGVNDGGLQRSCVVPGDVQQAHGKRQLRSIARRRNL